MLLSGPLDEVAEQPDRILQSVAATAYTNAQEWGNRIDCLIRLPDGSVAGEMIPLDQATEQRIRETGQRLEQRGLGIPVALQNELSLPIRIVRRTS